MKLVLIKEKRNRRVAQFCKKLRLQNFILSRKRRFKKSGTPSGVWNMKHETFFILKVIRINRISRRDGFWLILERCGSFSAAEWIAENSVFWLNYAISRFVFESSDIAAADVFCKNCPFVDFKKLWSNEVFNCFS